MRDTSTSRVSKLAIELTDWLSTRKDTSIQADAVEVFLEDFFVKESLNIKEDKSEKTFKIPALFKSENADAKRMRELAGIPHRGNFV